MKVAVSAGGRDLDALVDPLFGRCECFIIVDTTDMSFEVFSNEFKSLNSESGILSAEFVTSKGAKVVTTCQCGPHAMRTLSAAGVELFTGQTGTVRGAVGRYKNGEFKFSNEFDRSNFQGAGGGPARIGTLVWETEGYPYKGL